MGFRTHWLLCLLGASMLSKASAQGVADSSFEERLNMYSDWANQIQSKGRSLSWAMSPQPGPTPPPTPPPGPTPPGPTPPGPTPPGPTPPGPTPPGPIPPGPTPPGPTPPGPHPTPPGPTPPGPTPPPSCTPSDCHKPECKEAPACKSTRPGQVPIVVQPPPYKGPTPSTSTVYVPNQDVGNGVCKVLRYAPDPYAGYANLTLNYNKIIKDSPNFGECCKSCNADPNCLAWTRVAGGDPLNFRNCYLKYNLTDLDRNLVDAQMHNHIGHIGDDIKYPELRYVDVNYPSAAWPLILESGTKPDVYPPDYYGCPYASVPTTPCVAPPTCNVNGEGQFVWPPCIG